MLNDYEDYIDRINIQEVLKDAGYKYDKHNGKRYPTYIRFDSEGQRVRGDKYIVSPNGKTCCQQPLVKGYNIISFIKEHPTMFSDYAPGMDPDRLVNLVCQRLLQRPIEEKQQDIIIPERDHKPFDLSDYDIQRFDTNDRETQKPFFPYFKAREINLSTQYAFQSGFFLAKKHSDTGEGYQNLAFPMYIPGQSDIVGLEERGWTMKDGTSYKGMAAGSNAGKGMWLYSPCDTPTEAAKRVYLFESAYDAMAFYQLHVGKDSTLTPIEKSAIKKSLFASTGGSPSYAQQEGLIKATPNAEYHIGFDNDLAGQQFASNFQYIADRVATDDGRSISIIREVPSDGYKDFNDELKGKIASSAAVQEKAVVASRDEQQQSEEERSAKSTLHR